MRKYIQRSILKGETRPSHKVVSPTLVCATPIQIIGNNAIIPTFDFDNAPPAFTLILEEDSFGFIQSHSITINNSNVGHIKLRIESVTKLNNGQPKPIFSVDTVSAFITISAPNASFLRVLPFDGADYEESAHVHLGLIPDPDPRGTSYASDFNLRSATSLDNKTSVLTSYIAPYEDRTSESVNRAIDSVANNAENTYLDVSDPYYKVVQVKINPDIGNDELINFIQDSNFTSDAIVPIMRNIPNVPWVRSIKQDVLEVQLNSFPSGQSNLDIIAYATNKPIYVANRFENRTDIPRTANFKEIYLASRERAVDIIANGVDGYAGFSQCTNSTKIITNNDILLGNESSYESYIKSGKVDDLFGSEKIISNPGTFWIASADVTQQQLDTCFIKVQDQLKANNVNVGDEFNAISKRGYVSFPGTLYGTKAMTGSFKCLDRGTIRYVQENQEKLPIFVSEGMLVTNGFDAYEIEQVVDQKTLLLKPVSNYEDILLGDVSLLQRVELRPDIIQDFDIYFGKYISKTQIAIFATRPISVESIISSQRENNDLQSRQTYLDLGLLLKLHDTRLGTSVMDNQDDNFTSEENISNIGKRLALFNKFARSVVGAGLTTDNSVSPISLESLASNASDTRSPFKSSAHYVSQPLAPDIQDEGYITVPQVLALNLLRKNSTRQSFVAATQLNYTLKPFETKLINGIKQFCDWCFLGYTNIVGGFDRFVWSDLIYKIETRDSEAVLQEMLSSKLPLILGLDIEEISRDSAAFKEFTSLVYSALKYYGYTSNLATTPLGQFDIAAPENKIQVALFNDVKIQYLEAMNQFGNAKYLGSNIFRLQANDETVDEFFSIEDIGKPFTLSYLHISANDSVIPYVKQIRVFMDEWYNGACVRFSFDGMHHNEVDGILNNPCFIGYAPGDVDEVADITEVLQGGSSKAQMIDTFSADMTLSRMFTTSFRASNTYFMERSFSNIVISSEYTYIFLPGINAFENDCEALTLLPKFIGSHINLDLATMTYDLARIADLIPANVTTSQDFLNNFIKPFFDTEIISQNDGSVVKITPKQNIGVNSVYLDIKMANPSGRTTNKLVECTKTCIAYDGTIVLRVDTAALMTNADRDLFLARSPVNPNITQRINTLAQFNGVDTNRFEINYVGGPGNINQWYVDTMPIRRNLLAQSNVYAVIEWFAGRNISVINHKQQASVNIYSIANIQQAAGNTKVIVGNQYIQKKALDSKISVDIRPNPESFKVNEFSKHIEIESFNDSTAISILQKTSISQSKNRIAFLGQRGQDNDINSAIQITTEPRSFNEQSLEAVDNHPTLKIGEQIPALLYKKRQAGIHATSVSNQHSITPAVLGVIDDNSNVPEASEADNFSIGAITAINKLDNQVFAQSAIRPTDASLQANQNVVIDDSIIYEGSDNVLSGNARSNWKGTGFKRLGGRATSLNTITSARQPDSHAPPSDTISSYASAHYKLSGKKIFRYVDSRKSQDFRKGRGFSSDNINILGNRSQNFKDIKNVGIAYDKLPNYIGENDILFSYLKNAPLNYTIDDENRGLFTVLGLFDGSNNLYTFSRFADSNRTVSIRIIFGKNANSAFLSLEGSGFATGHLPSALETIDVDFETNQVYATDFLLDSLITDDMVRAYQDKFNITQGEAYSRIKENAIGGEGIDTELMWLAASGNKVQVLLHGREWNANLHALNVSGGLSIGNNFKDKTLEIVVDKERSSALINVPNGSLSINVDNTLNIDAESVEGTGLVDIQKKVLNTQELSIPLTRNITLMMLHTRPKINRNITGSTLAQLRDRSSLIFASSYILEKIDMLYVPGNTAVTGDMLSVARIRHNNVLDFKQTADTTYIHRMDVPGAVTNVLGEEGSCIPRHEVDDTDAFTHTDGRQLDIGKKYFMVDLHDYISAEIDPTLTYIRTHMAMDVAKTESTANNQVSTDITTVLKNDLVNCYQVGDQRSGDVVSTVNGQVTRILAETNGNTNVYVLPDNAGEEVLFSVENGKKVFVRVNDSVSVGQILGHSSVSEPFSYDALLGKLNEDKNPLGMIRALTTEDGTNSLVFNTKDPLNIVKLEARALYTEQTGARPLRENVRVNTLNIVQDYGLAENNMNYPEEMGILRLVRNPAVVTSIPITVISRYNSRAYIVPSLDPNNGKIIYIIQFAGPEIVFSVMLNTYVQDGYVYPVSDLNIESSGVITETNNAARILTDYERVGTNNIISADFKDIDGNMAFFTRPLITWINFSAAIKAGDRTNIGDIVSITFQPAQYMPLWLDRETSYWDFTQEDPNGPSYPPKRGFFDHVEKTNYAAGFIYTSLYKLLRCCTEVELDASNSDLKPTSISIGNASIKSKSYNQLLTFADDDPFNSLGVYSGLPKIYAETPQTEFTDKFRRNIRTTLNLKNLNIEQEALRVKDVTNQEVLIRSFPKKIVRVQGKSDTERKRYYVSSEAGITLDTIEKFEANNRSYYNLLSRLDFLNVRQQDGFYLNIYNELKWFQTNQKFNAWLKDEENDGYLEGYRLDNFNIGQYIKAFLSAAVDCNRVSRIRNAELPNMSSEADFPTNSRDPDAIARVKKFFADKIIVSSLRDANDVRQAGAFTKISIPYVIRFNRK